MRQLCSGMFDSIYIYIYTGNITRAPHFRLRFLCDIIMNPDNKLSLLYAATLVIVAVLCIKLTEIRADELDSMKLGQKMCNHSGINGRCSWYGWEPWTDCTCKCATEGTQQRTRYSDEPAFCPAGCHPSEETQGRYCTIPCDHGTPEFCGLCQCDNTGYYGDCCEIGQFVTFIFNIPVTVYYRKDSVLWGAVCVAFNQASGSLRKKLCLHDPDVTCLSME